MSKKTFQKILSNIWTVSILTGIISGIISGFIVFFLTSKPIISPIIFSTGYHDVDSKRTYVNVTVTVQNIGLSAEENFFIVVNYTNYNYSIYSMDPDYSGCHSKKDNSIIFNCPLPASDTVTMKVSLWRYPFTFVIPCTPEQCSKEPSIEVKIIGLTSGKTFVKRL